MKKLMALAVLLLLCSSYLFSQAPPTKQIKGKIVDDATGLPLTGATIMMQGVAGRKGAQTDSSGNFTIRIPDDGKKHDLLISYVGYTAEVVSSADAGIVKLKTIKGSGDEVVVIGYSTVKRRDLIGSVSSVGAKQLKDIPSNSAADAITGRLAGVQVTTDQGQPGSDFTIKIRGGGSITQDNSPLYIVDGIQVENALSAISPQDIESVDVLKDAAATAIYGARGANGVIIITTKGGKNTQGKTTISYNGLVGFSQLPRELGVLDPYNYVEYQWERNKYMSPSDSAVVLSYAPVWDSVAKYKNYPATDWQHLVFGQNAFIQTHNVSMSGGNAMTQYNLSLTDNEQAGVMINSGFSRQMVNFRLDHKVNDKLKVGFNVRYNNQLQSGAGTTNGETTTSASVQSYSNLRQSVRYTPIVPIGQSPYTYNNAYIYNGVDVSNGNSMSLINPILLSNAQYRKNYTNIFNVNGYINYNFTKWLMFRSSLGFDQNSLRQDFFDDTLTINSKLNGAAQPIASVTNTVRTTINNSNVLTFSNAEINRGFSKKNKIIALVGQEIYYAETKGNSVMTKYFPIGISPSAALANMNLVMPPTGATQPLPTSSDVKTNIASFFTRVNYEFDKKYSASVSVRADGSSIFGSQKKWGYFPSASLAWKVSNEDFMRGLQNFSDVKLRASYGTAGNNRIPPFQYLTQYVTATGIAPSTTPVGYGLNNTLFTGYSPQSLANALLQWEVTHSVNFGLDFTVFKRFTLTTDVYFNKTDKLLINNPSIPTSSGYNSQYQNIGSTTNKGIEFQLLAPIISKNGFNWNANFNISFNKNTITDIGGLPPILISSGAVGTASDFVVQKGSPVGAMYGYLSDGFYKVSDFTYNSANQTYTLNKGVANNIAVTGVAPQPGVMKLKGLNGDSAITAADRTVIGNANPKFFGGLNQQFQYKNFDASIFINFSYGGQVLNANKIEFSSGYTPGANLLSDFKSRWRNVDDNGNLVKDPGALAALNANATIWSPSVTSSSNAFIPVSWAVEDGSFIRINNITIGYSLPDKILSHVKVAKFRIYATVNNLAVITHYSGYDPEVNTRRSTPTTPGVDYSAYPRSRNYVFGINMSF
ncbi:SusC/RagA family TonB-linked outer membrane protein [Chitinophagaceae bacterium LWZ2-11]